MRIFESSLVDGRGYCLGTVYREKPQSIDEAMACLETGQAATVAKKDMAELRRRLETRAMLSDPEYAIPGKLDDPMRALERRVQHLEVIVHRLLNKGEPDGRDTK